MILHLSPATTYLFGRRIYTGLGAAGHDNWEYTCINDAQSVCAIYPILRIHDTAILPFHHCRRATLMRITRGQHFLDCLFDGAVIGQALPWRCFDRTEYSHVRGRHQIAVTQVDGKKHLEIRWVRNGAKINKWIGQYISRVYLDRASTERSRHVEARIRSRAPREAANGNCVQVRDDNFSLLLVACEYAWVWITAEECGRILRLRE